MENHDIDIPPALAKRIKRHLVGRVREYYAVTAPGLEKWCYQELVSLLGPESRVEQEPGGVTFYGKLVDCYAANLHLRTATRVLIRITRFKATNLSMLARQIQNIDWELFLGPQAKIKIHVTSQKSRLYHSQAVSDTIVAGIAEYFKTPANNDRIPVNGMGVSQTVFVRILDDRVTVSIDTSGQPLYKRGIKTHRAIAPLRETLAAAILMICRFDGKSSVIDPMCGSGTFALEAAMMAKNIAPGLYRDFAFMQWPFFQHKKWAFLKQTAQERQKKCLSPLIFASDIDPKSCEHLSDCLKRFELTDAVRVECEDFFARSPQKLGIETGKGFVVLNPPYGRRLRHTADKNESAGTQLPDVSALLPADAFYAKIGHKIKADYPGWTIGMIVPQKRFVTHILKKLNIRKISHGGLQLFLCHGKIG